ncbi:hypothetical protein ACWD4N_46110 [Streptomyces sp. NPDC002586]
MVIEIPLPLRPCDGHASAPLAARLRADLRRIGVPVHVIGGLDPVRGGVVKMLDNGRVSMAWSKPDQDTRRHGSDQLAAVTHTRRR